jgi:hypothetical protein
VIANYIMDHIPWWGWALMIAVPVGALLFYFGPVLVPLWLRLPLWLRTVLIFCGVGFLIYRGGVWQGRRNEEERERRRNADALNKRLEVDREIDKMEPAEVQKKLRDRWGAGDDAGS